MEIGEPQREITIVPVVIPTEIPSEPAPQKREVETPAEEEVPA